jgi:Flp pilus assembly pilin Flp
VRADLRALGLGALGCGKTTTNDQRGSYMLRRLLKDESGQTMLEYIVIVVFVVIAAIIAFRLVKSIVQKNIERVSASFDTD